MYWLGFLLGNLGSFNPDPPDIVYVVRYEPDATTHTIDLPGTEAPEVLMQTLRLLRPASQEA